jgi:hypothetical protein
MTAVEFLGKQALNYLNDEQENHFIKVIQQAIEMEKQQIMEAHVFGFKECEKIHEEAFFIQDLSEQYYNETYKPSA